MWNYWFCTWTSYQLRVRSYLLRGIARKLITWAELSTGTSSIIRGINRLLPPRPWMKGNGWEGVFCSVCIVSCQGNPARRIKSLTLQTTLDSKLQQILFTAIFTKYPMHRMKKVLRIRVFSPPAARIARTFWSTENQQGLINHYGQIWYTGCPAVHSNFDTPLISGIGWPIRLIF